jgi:ComF family protein
MGNALINIKNAYESFIEFAFPPLCAGCGEFCDTEYLFCKSCQDRIDRYEYPFCLTCHHPVISGVECGNCGPDSFLLFALGNYTDPLKESIVQFKFKGVTRLAGYFAEELSNKFADRIKDIHSDLLIPIPLHPSREHTRGYNQAELLARSLSKVLNINLESDLLMRIHKRKSQARLNDRERADNIKGVFQLQDVEKSTQSIILVDDVVTGGYTASEARKTLISGGYHVPAVIAVAHGL